VSSAYAHRKKSVLVLALAAANTPVVGAGHPSEPDGHRPDRYEPLPGSTRLPSWVWSRMGRGVRITLGVVLLAAVAAAVPLIVAISQSKQERAESERRERSELQEQHIRRLQAEQRPRFGRSESAAPAGARASVRLAARARLLDEVSATILADARRRVRAGALNGPIVRVRCEPFPRTAKGVGADKDLSRRRGRYSCLAVTTEFERSEVSVGGALGHPYRAKVDFETGRYAYCKISGRPDPTPDPRVTTPEACGGA
jgi:hypothetical protein